MDNGYKELYLIVTEGNEPAEHLYKKIGFQKLPPSLAQKI
jgi:ribosomal protein S18 acetylase RimI-like enzyme